MSWITSSICKVPAGFPLLAMVYLFGPGGRQLAGKKQRVSAFEAHQEIFFFFFLMSIPDSLSHLPPHCCHLSAVWAVGCCYDQDWSPSKDLWKKWGKNINIYFHGIFSCNNVQLIFNGEIFSLNLTLSLIDFLSFCSLVYNHWHIQACNNPPQKIPLCITYTENISTFLLTKKFAAVFKYSIIFEYLQKLN